MPARSGGPTSTTGMPSAAAWRAPATISPGAWSPPMASTATGSMASVGTAAQALTSMATRSLYQPQVGHTVCGSLALPQRGQTLRAGRRASRRRRGGCAVFDFDFFFLGTAIVVSAGRTGCCRLAGRRTAIVATSAAMPAGRPPSLGVSVGRGARRAPPSGRRVAARRSRTALVAVGAARRAQARRSRAGTAARGAARAGAPRGPAARGRAGRRSIWKASRVGDGGW